MGCPVPAVRAQAWMTRAWTVLWMDGIGGQPAQAPQALLLHPLHGRHVAVVSEAHLRVCCVSYNVTVMTRE